jgi:DNA (cytosine-5)-methyltransferase 1
MSLNVLSLFAGIGGLELGFERAGMTVIGQVEIDPFCRKVLEKHWPDVPKHDDVRTAVQWWESETRPHVDLICGGFPCQPFSAAGQRRGIADERWGWPWMRDVIDAIRPRIVLIENVAELLRDTEAFSIVLSDLSDLRFDVEWDAVSACSVGASHRRRRLFVVAYPSGAGLQGLHETRRQVDLQPVARDVRRHWATEPALARVAYGIPRRLVRDDIHALGNAVVPQVSEYVGAQLLAALERAA